MTIWLTRPAADSLAMAEQLRAHHITSIIAPVLEIHPVPYTITSHPDAILLTSRHAVSALPQELKSLPIYCVGQSTAEAARATGCITITTGDGDIRSLLPRIARELPSKSLLYLSGEDITVDIAPLLASQQVMVERVIAYRATAIPSLPSSIATALQHQQLTGVVFYSARSAEIATSLLTTAQTPIDTGGITAYCLSLHIAEKLGALPWRSIRVAHAPTSQAMLAMLTAAE